MLIEIKGIKENAGITKDVDILLEMGSLDLAKKYLLSKNIIVLSIKEFFGTKKDFGYIYAVLNNNLENIVVQNFEIILKNNDIKDAYFFLDFLGFECIWINFLDNPKDDEYIKNILIELHQDRSKKQALNKIDIANKKISKKNIYEDNSLNTMQEIASKIIRDLDVLDKNSGTLLDYKKRKDLDIIRGELRKVKMSRNITKVKESVTKAKNIVKEIWNIIIEDRKNNEYFILPDSTISNIDLVDEYNKFEYSVISQRGGLQEDFDDKFYIFFQKLGIYLKMLWSEIFTRLDSRSYVLYSLFGIIEGILIIVGFQIGFIIRFKKTILFQQIPEYLLIILVHIGVAGLCILVGRLIKKNNAFILFLIFIGLIISYFTIIKFITLNIAL